METPVLDGQDVDQGLAFGGAARQRQAPGLELVDHAVGGEEQKPSMRICDEKRRHHVVILGLHAGQTLAAAVLGAEFGQRGALDVAAGGDGDDHILTLDQVFVLHVAGPVEDLGAAGDGEEGFHLAQLVRDDRHDAVAGAEDVEVVLDLARPVLQARR